MKKIIIIGIILIINICICFVSCSNVNESSNENNTDIENKSSCPDANSTTIYEDQPISQSIVFFTYEDLENWIKNNKLDVDLPNKSPSSNEDRNNIENINLQNVPIYVPYLNGEAINLRDDSGVSIFSVELYGKPWIFWNSIDFDGVHVSFRQALLNDNEISEFDGKNISQVIRTIAPDAPNINNIDKYPDYKSIEEKTVYINDTEVQALFLLTEWNETDRLYIEFMYENSMFVLFVMGSDDIPNTFWNEFSMNLLS